MKTWRLYLHGIGFVTVLIVGAQGSLVYAQEMIDRATFASPLQIQGGARNGDIVSYDPVSQTYHAAQMSQEATMFGVVVDDPVLYFESSTIPEGARPIVRFGEAMVNVADLMGEVRPGDLITSSGIPGVGVRTEREEATTVLGFAIEPMKYDERVTPMVVDGREVRFGTVSVALQIGPYVGDQGTGTTTAALTEAIEKLQEEGEGGSEAIDPFKIFKYLLGTFVAITAVVLALRRFGDLFAQSVISVGRNPLARSQIRSILIWNAVLIIVVSSVGLGLGVAIIMIP